MPPHSTAILWPMFALAGWTMCMLLFLAFRRVKASAMHKISPREYALGEFIDRYGPRLAHFNGVLQLFAQLGAPLPTSDTTAGN